MLLGWKGRVKTEYEREYEVLKGGSKEGSSSSKAKASFKEYGGFKQNLGTAAGAKAQAQEAQPSSAPPSPPPSPPAEDKEEKPPSAFSRKMAALRANPWFKLLMWMRTHATGLVVQVRP